MAPWIQQIVQMRMDIFLKSLGKADSYPKPAVGVCAIWARMKQEITLPTSVGI
jgi:hypothetical protein